MTDLEILGNKPEYLAIPRSLPFKDWWEYRHQLERLKRGKDLADICVPLQTMDWIFNGEEMYDEKASQGLAFVEEVMGWNANTYSAYRAVWERFRTHHERPEGIGITFYQAVMGLPKNKALELLEMASRNKWTRSQLRKAVRHHTHPEGTEPKNPTCADVKRAALGVLRNLKISEHGLFYELEPEPAQELALAMEFAVREIVVEAEVVEGQEELDV